MKRQNDETPSGRGKGFQSNQKSKPEQFTRPAKFIGTDNPRHLRAIAAMLRRPLPREALDSTAGASNGPELVAELRRRGLEVPCERVTFIDRDGQKCRPGVYSFTASDRRKVYRWMATAGRGVAA
jgi:hypothetical protein